MLICSLKPLVCPDGGETQNQDGGELRKLWRRVLGACLVHQEGHPAVLQQDMLADGQIQWQLSRWNSSQSADQEGHS